VPYLAKYALIKACGTIEAAYKNIIADFCSKRTKKQIKTFLTNRVRESPRNPSYSNICSLLKEFDGKWHEDLKRKIDEHPDKAEIITSFESIVDSRNELAHGGNPIITITDVIRYFRYCRIVVEEIDNILT